VRWPWRRRTDGAEARQARENAERAEEQARTQAPRVAEVVREAGELARRTKDYAREVERSMRLRGSS
jgi:hypothetical protein